jgi:hypothetical protein
MPDGQLLGAVRTAHRAFLGGWLSNTTRWDAVSPYDQAILGLCIICDTLQMSGAFSQTLAARIRTIEERLACWSMISHHDCTRETLSDRSGRACLKTIYKVVMETTGSSRPVVHFFVTTPSYPVICTAISTCLSHGDSGGQHPGASFHGNDEYSFITGILGLSVLAPENGISNCNPLKLWPPLYGCTADPLLALAAIARLMERWACRPSSPEYALAIQAIHPSP